MPYNKKGILARYSKVPYAPGKSVAAKASKALYIASKVSKALNVEKKWHDSYTGANFAATTQHIILLNNVPQGDGGDERDGDQVKFTSMFGRFNIDNEDEAAHTFRIMIVRDRQSDGTTPSITEILETDGGAIATVQALNNMDNKMRFQTLYDKRFVVPGKNETVASGPYSGSTHQKVIDVALNYYKKFKMSQGLKTRYFANVNGGTVADISSNPVWLILACNSTVADSATIFANVRHRFVDN